MEIKYVDYSISDGILIAVYKEKLVVTIEQAKEMVADRLAFQNGKEYPIVIHMNGIKASTKEARIFMGTDGIKGITIGAFVVRHVIEQVIFNFFFKIEKPNVSTKAFTNEEDAIAWIREVQNKTNAA